MSIQSKKGKKKFVNHILMRNEYYICAGYSHDWKNEKKISDKEYTAILDES